MSIGGYREEVLNVLLAQLLDEQSIISAPEKSLRQPDKGRKVPDIIVLFQGLRTVIEGKVDDHPGAAEEVINDVRQRVEQGIAHIGIAVLYPATLRQVNFHSLKSELSQITLGIAICSEAGESGWTEGNLNHLGALLRRTFDQLIAEDVVAQAVAALESGVEKFAQAIAGLPAAIERSADVLGIGEPLEATDKELSGEE
jgi:hypothetical protein